MTDPHEPKIPSTLTPERYEEIGKRVEAFKVLHRADGGDYQLFIDLFAEVQFLSGLINDLVQDGAAERWESGYAKGYQDAIDSSNLPGNVANDELTHSHHGWGEEKTRVSFGAFPYPVTSATESRRWSGTESTSTPTYTGPVQSTLMEALQTDEAKAIREGMNRGNP